MTATYCLRLSNTITNQVHAYISFFCFVFSVHRSLAPWSPAVASKLLVFDGEFVVVRDFFASENASSSENDDVL